MSIMKKLLITAAILIVIGLLGTLFTIKSFFQGNDLVTNEQVLNETYENVQVNVENMSVNLYVSQENETKIISSTSNSGSTVAEVINGTLNINVDEPTTFNMNLFSFDFLNKFPSVTIYLPEEVYKEINVRSENGMVAAKGLQADRVSVATINGLIQMETIQSEATEVVSENGKVTLNDITGDIVSRTTNGMISYETEKLEQNIDFKTVNGLISIQTKTEPTNVTFDVFVELGQVDIFGSERQNTTYGNGDYLIKLTTSLGKVTVQKRI